MISSFKQNSTSWKKYKNNLIDDVINNEIKKLIWFNCVLLKLI